jgi:hypothetical protein
MATDLQQVIREQILVLPESEREKLYEFMQSLREEKRDDLSSRPISEIFDELSSQIPYEEWAELPSDGAENHDHYLYGHPKKAKS